MQAHEIDVECEVFDDGSPEVLEPPADSGDLETDVENEADPESTEEQEPTEGTERSSEPAESKDDGGLPVENAPLSDSPAPAERPGSIETGARDIGRLYNIAAESVTLLAHESSKQTLDDLLKNLRGRPRHLPRLDLDRDASTPTLGSDDALIFVTCHYHDIALAAAHSLIETQFPDHNKHYLDLAGAARDCTIDVLEQIQETVETPRVILIEITHETTFLESLKFGGHTSIDHITSSLRSHKTTIVCTSADRLFEDGVDETILSKSQVPHWKISFGRCILAQVYGLDAARAEQDIARQRQEGRWPQNTTEFYAEIRRYWESGAAALKEQVELRRTDEGLRKAQALTAAEVFPQNHSVEQLAICTAVYFQDLTPRDFDMVLAKVLEDQMIVIEETEDLLKDDGEIVTVRNKVPKPMTVVWRQTPDAILHRCQLFQVATGSGDRAIDFSKPYLRRQMRLFIEERYPILVTDFFTKLQDQGLVFDPNLSAGITHNLIRLAVQRTLEDPSYYGEKWLIDSVIGMKRFVTVHFESDDDQATQFAKMLASIHHLHLWNHFCSRLSDLIREMLKHPALEDLVHRFLRNLLNRHHHGATLDIVIHITRNLRFVRRFDSLYWMRILLDQGQADVRSKTYGVLHHLALASGGRIYEFLAGIHGWLPEPERKPENYSPSQSLALQFIMVFTLGTANSYRSDFYGEWPCKYILFKALDEDEQEAATQIGMLLSWMHHPGLLTVIRDDVEDKEEAHQRNVADVIEIWCWILEGIRPSTEAAPKAMTLVNLILSSLAEKADRDQRRIILKRWNERQRLYLDHLNRLPIARRGERKELKAQRLKVIELGRRFQRRLVGAM